MDALKTLGPPTAAIAGLLLVAGGAHAAPAVRAVDDSDTVSVRVPLGDLNLGDGSGAIVALRRMHEAAAAVCGGEPSLRDLWQTQNFRWCVEKTVDQGVASLDNPYVTALNDQHRMARPALLASAP